MSGPPGKVPVKSSGRVDLRAERDDRAGRRADVSAAVTYATRNEKKKAEAAKQAATAARAEADAARAEADEARNDAIRLRSRLDAVLKEAEEALTEVREVHRAHSETQAVHRENVSRVRATLDKLQRNSRTEIEAAKAETAAAKAEAAAAKAEVEAAKAEVEAMKAHFDLVKAASNAEIITLHNAHGETQSIHGHNLYETRSALNSTRKELKFAKAELDALKRRRLIDLLRSARTRRKKHFERKTKRTAKVSNVPNNNLSSLANMLSGIRMANQVPVQSSQKKPPQRFGISVQPQSTAAKLKTIAKL